MRISTSRVIGGAAANDNDYTKRAQMSLGIDPVTTYGAYRLAMIETGDMLIGI